MNQTFDLHRFGLMLKLDWAEKGKNYLFIALLLLALLFLMMMPITLSKQFRGMLEISQVMALFIVVFSGSTFYTIPVFSQYARPSTGMAAIMVPASATEKFLSALLINLIFIAPFIFLYWKLHYSTLAFANARLIGTPKYNPLPDDVVAYFTYCYFLIHGFLFLGSIYFQKAAYVKTAAIAVGTFTVATALQVGLAYQFTSYPGHVSTFPLGGWKIWYFNTAYNSFEVLYPDPFKTIVYIFPVLILVGLWSIAYIRLKEKEI
jgi:hypothetical protein